MKCPNCGCTVREDREDCPFCGVILPAKTGVLSQGSEITQQMIRKSVQPNMERRINRELRRANLQHGEIGLDYYWDSTRKEEQKQLFRRQIELAQQCLAVEDYDGAISAYYAAIDLDETRETAYLGLANIYETRGELNYLNYILETGYRNTNSAEIERRLDDLNASLLEQKTGDGSGLTYLNAPLLQRFAQATYGELNSYYGGTGNQNDAGTSVTGETLSACGDPPG